MPLRNQPLHLRVQATENWVEEVLAFANLEDPAAPERPKELRKYYDGLINLNPEQPGVWVDPEKSSFLHVLHDFSTVPGHAGFGDCQARLREVLNTLTAHGKTSEVDQLISDGIEAVQVHGSFNYKDGHLRFQSFVHFQSPDQWWAIGIAALLDAGLSSRVRQCGWEKCSDYFVDWPGRKGQAKYYCCPEHQNAERQRRYRENAKDKRRLQKANQSMGV